MTNLIVFAAETAPEEVKAMTAMRRAGDSIVIRDHREAEFIEG